MCRTMVQLLDMFKALMAPYTSSLLAPVTEVLSMYESGKLKDPVLWTELVELMDKTFRVDDGEGKLSLVIGAGFGGLIKTFACTSNVER